jgi:hypothetical protein
MKKGNPDLDEMPGGARIESKQRGTRTPSRTRHKTKAAELHSEKRHKDSRSRSSSGQEVGGERSQKTGKRSRAQKPRPTTVIGPA